MVDIVDAPAAMDVYAIYTTVEDVGGEQQPVDHADWLATLRTPDFASLFIHALQQSGMPEGMTFERRLP